MANKRIELVLDLDDKGFVKAISGDKQAVGQLQRKLNGVDKSATGVKKVDTAFKGLGSTIGKLGLVGAVSGLALGIGKAINASKELASAAEETENKFRAVYGDMADQANGFAQTLSESVGRNITDTKNGLAAFEGFARGLGLSGGKAFEMSTQLQKLSIDFASFNNLSDGEAQQRFIAAMSGSGEVLDMFGINVKQNALDLKLQEMGLAKSTLAATEAQKAMARYQIILETMQTQGAVDDAIKTADSFANSQKRMNSEIKTAGEALGKLFIPAFTEIVTVVGKAADVVGDFFDSLRPKTILDTVEALKKYGAETDVIAKFEAQAGILEANKRILESQKELIKLKKEFVSELDAQATLEQNSAVLQDLLIEKGKVQKVIQNNQLAIMEAENAASEKRNAADNAIIKNRIQDARRANRDAQKRIDDINSTIKAMETQNEAAGKYILNSKTIEASQKEIKTLQERMLDTDNKIVDNGQKKVKDAKTYLKTLKDIDTEIKNLQKDSAEWNRKYNFGRRIPAGGAFGTGSLPKYKYASRNTNIDTTVSAFDKLYAMFGSGQDAVDTFTFSFDEFLKRVNLGSNEFEGMLAGAVNAGVGFTEGNPIQVLSGVVEIVDSFVSAIKGSSAEASNQEFALRKAAQAQKEFNQLINNYTAALNDATLAELWRIYHEAMAEYEKYLYHDAEKAAKAGKLMQDTMDQIISFNNIAVNGINGFFEQVNLLNNFEWDNVNDKIAAFGKLFKKTFGFDFTKYLTEDTLEKIKTGLSIGKTPFEVLFGPTGVFPGLGGNFTKADANRLLDFILGILQNTGVTAKNTDPTTATRLDESTFTLSTMNTITVQQANEFVAISRAILNEHQKTNRFLEDFKGGVNLGTIQAFTNLVTVQASQAEVNIARANVSVLGDGGTTKQKISQVENEQYLSVSRS